MTTNDTTTFLIDLEYNRGGISFKLRFTASQLVYMMVGSVIPSVIIVAFNALFG